ncbi:MAG: HDOD domain-containing protein [Gemmatimonadales bacterium]|nr:HDOD domain-containing protein [Gemmatimonadales bacterium]
MIDKSKILATIDSVPSLPSVVIQLRQYLNDPDVNFDQLAHVLQHDPGLTANILQLANSAYFGWSRSIKSVREAITRLGTDRVFQMVLCMSVAPLVRKPINGYDMDSNGLWEHSISTAICAEQLAIALNLEDTPEAFTSGLLHDLGKIVLGTFVEVDDEPIKEIVRSDNLAFNEAEQMVLGIDHAEAAGELLRVWNLPDEVVASARWHHEPSQAKAEHRQLTDLIHVADSLCIRTGWGMGQDGLLYKVDEEAFARLGITSSLAEEVILKVSEGLEDLKDIFKARPKQKPNSAQFSSR